jgi:diadenosine tetraphosphatase ApaH/serine/threonine PP2A family protein phosphatase
MRYAIFTDIHANLEALEAVLAKIDQLAQEDPIDQIWFLGDLVGYGPNPNECIDMLRERTDMIIAGNHDWAAVGKIDLEDFSEAARISAEWTAEQLTEDHRTFLANLPERLEKDDCTLVHGSPYGPLWEYLTSEVLAERSFQYFATRFCIVGHTHVPVIFQQPDVIANSPTAPLELNLQSETEEEALQRVIEQAASDANEEDIFLEVDETEDNEDEAVEHEQNELHEEQQIEEPAQSEEYEQVEADKTPVAQYASQLASHGDRGAYSEAASLEEIVAEAADVVAEVQYQMADDIPNPETMATPDPETTDTQDSETTSTETEALEVEEQDTVDAPEADEADKTEETDATEEIDTSEGTDADQNEITIEATTPEITIQDAEERLNEEIEELLSLLGLSQSMINVTNEMIIPPEGDWQTPKGYRAIINPGGVGQPRDGDARAAFMIYDTEHGFTFYRVPYSFEQTQEKIIQANLPQYLATRLAYGR